MSDTKTLKIFHGASLFVGETIAGFVIDSIDSPFTDSTFVNTETIDSIVGYAGGVTTITAGGQSFEIERVKRPEWMNLMSKLEAYRQSVQEVDQK
ncbi:MAG: hypothetical protein HY309_24395 [Pseudomonas fluorescens]|nr:hypothetical protein [Pseudomonas fluorescens]